MAQACGPDVAAQENPGVMLGLVIGVLAQAGRNKLTIVASPTIQPFGAWAEQLLAESIGKDGKAVIPIIGEPLGAPPVYGADRLFIYLRDAASPHAAQDRAIDTLAQAGHPVARILLPLSTLSGPRILPLRNRERRRWCGSRHQSVRPAGRRSEQDRDPRDHRDIREDRSAALRAAGFRSRWDGSLCRSAQRPDASPAGAGSTLESWFKALLSQLTAGFGTIEAAQACGDFRVLAERGRRILHVHLASNADAGLATIRQAMHAALA